MIRNLLKAIPGIDADACGDEVAYNIIITGAVIYAIYLSDGTHYYAKVTDKFDMKHEFDGTARAFKAMPENVAEPVAFQQFGQNQVIICRGVHHTPMTRKEILKPDEFVTRGLLGFFSRGAEVFLADSPSLPAVQDLESLLTGTVSARAAACMLQFFDETNRKFLDGKAVLQHGDFTVNNLGRTTTGLVFFDWEDYGKISAVGFDLCMLVVSTLNFEAGSVKAFRQRGDGDPFLGLVCRAARSLGLSSDGFFSLIPYYLMLNAHLKRDYGKAITETNIRLAESLIG